MIPTLDIETDTFEEQLENVPENTDDLDAPEIVNDIIRVFNNTGYNKTQMDELQTRVVTVSTWYSPAAVQTYTPLPAAPTTAWALYNGTTFDLGCREAIDPSVAVGYIDLKFPKQAVGRRLRGVRLIARIGSSPPSDLALYCNIQTSPVDSAPGWVILTDFNIIATEASGTGYQEFEVTPGDVTNIANQPYRMRLSFDNGTAGVDNQIDFHAVEVSYDVIVIEPTP